MSNPQPPHSSQNQNRQSNHFIYRIGRWLRNRERGLTRRADDLQGLSIIKLLNIIGSFSLVFGAIGYCSGDGERRKQKHYQAWQVIIAAVGQEAEMGRKAAIEDLWSDKVSLSDLDIHQARIPKLSLPPHCPVFKECMYVYLNNANLQEVDLSEAELQGANLSEANLEGAELYKAKLKQARFAAAKLQGAWLANADLEGAWFEDEANLKGASLLDTILHNTIFLGIDLREVEDLSKTQLTGEKPPFLCNSPVEEAFEIDPNRDCDRLPEFLKQQWPKEFRTLEDAREHVNYAQQRNEDEEE